MRRKRIKSFREGVLALVLSLVLVAILFGISWIVTCGLIKWITMCFGWTFKWSTATGIWLMICIARTIFKNSNSSK